MPRLRVHDLEDEREGHMPYHKVNSMVMTLREHNREPGLFNYKYPQTFYSTFPEIDQETYVTLGGNSKRRVHQTHVE